MNKSEKKFNFGEFYGKWGTLMILVVIAVLSACSVPNFVKPRNLINVLLQNAVVAMLAFSATFVIILGISTWLTVRPGGVHSAVISCLVMNAMQASLSPVVAALLSLVVAVVVGMVIGGINGYVITKFNIPRSL